MNTVNNAILTTTIVPVSNVVKLGGSLLPDRFISDSYFRQIGVSESDFGSSIHVDRQVGEVIIPANVS
jgi:hypothetical protein